MQQKQTPGWLTKHWNSVIAVVLSTIIAGVLGFSSSIILLHSRINELRVELTSLENLTKRKADQSALDKIVYDIARIENRISDVVRIENRISDVVMPATKILDSHREKLVQLEIMVVRFEERIWRVNELPSGAVRGKVEPMSK